MQLAVVAQPGKASKSNPSPFVKWAGGKSQLLGQYNPYFPKSIDTYYEPFLGSGAIFFHLFKRGLTEDAILSDFNQELMNCYRVIKDDADSLIRELKSGKYKNDKEIYYQIRSLDRKPGLEKLSKVERAARTIYLNRTCYNGLYRVNSRGHFNVPFGRYSNPKICDETNLRSVSQALKRARLMVGDFAKSLRRAKSGDFVYLDPPYDPLSQTADFTSYTSNGFGKPEQERLTKAFKNLDKKGVMVMLSNSNTGFIKELYDGFNLHRVKAKRLINSKVEGRGEITELLITNY